MQKCSSCGTDLPENARFCGKCGSVQDALATDAADPVAENEDERRRGLPPWYPLNSAALTGDALISSGQPYTPGVPVVQGTPQIGSVPSVAGSPTPTRMRLPAIPRKGQRMLCLSLIPRRDNSRRTTRQDSRELKLMGLTWLTRRRT